MGDPAWVSPLSGDSGRYMLRPVHFPRLAQRSSNVQHSSSMSNQSSNRMRITWLLPPCRFSFTLWTTACFLMQTPTPSLKPNPDSRHRPVHALRKSRELTLRSVHCDAQEGAGQLISLKLRRLCSGRFGASGAVCRTLRNFSILFYVISFVGGGQIFANKLSRTSSWCP